jgi:hypothetical protein
MGRNRMLEEGVAVRNSKVGDKLVGRGKKAGKGVDWQGKVDTDRS